MATIMRGKRKGEDVEIAQFCNDWFTTQDGAVVGVLSIRLTPNEQALVVRECQLGRTGVMFTEFEMTDDGRFRRRKR